MSIWQRITGQHKKVSLSDLEAEGPASRPLPPEMRDLAEARPHLLVRLCPADNPECSEGEDRLRQDPADGLAAVLTLDLPDGPRDVTPADAELWATPIAALFAIGLTNLGQEHRFKRTARHLPGGAELLAFRGESVFAAAQLLVVPTLLAEQTPYGALACVPKSDLLLVHPITGPHSLAALEELALLSARLYEAGPKSLSPHLYWSEGKRLMRLPVTLEGQTVHFRPPPRFAAKVVGPLQG